MLGKAASSSLDEDEATSGEEFEPHVNIADDRIAMATYEDALEAVKQA